MKKTISIMALVFVMILSCLCAVGCGDDGGSGKEGSGNSSDLFGGQSAEAKSETSIVGVWYLVDDSSFGFCFKEDYTYGEVNNCEYYEQGTYSVDGDNLKLNLYRDGSTPSGKYSIDGDLLTLISDADNGKYVYKRGSEEGLIYKGKETSTKNNITLQPQQ